MFTADTDFGDLAIWRFWRLAGMRRIGRGWRPIASAQSRVATLHLIPHELPVFLVVPVAIEVPASARSGGARFGIWVCR